MNSLSSIRPMQSISSQSKAILPEFELEMANTRKILECVPDDKLAWRPHEMSMTMGELASHVVDLVRFGVRALETKGVNKNGHRPDFPVAGSRQEMLERFDECTARFRQLLAQSSWEYMEQTWTLKTKKKVIFVPRSMVLRSMTINHLIHHRGQLTVYLRLNNVPFPGAYGPSADDLKAESLHDNSQRKVAL